MHCQFMLTHNLHNPMQSPLPPFKLEGGGGGNHKDCVISYDTSFSTQNIHSLNSLTIMLLTFTNQTLSNVLTSFTFLLCSYSHAINIMWWKNLQAFISCKNHLHLPILILYVTVNFIYYLGLSVMALVICVLHIIYILFQHTFTNKYKISPKKF
jgi:hypothetical protein